MPPSSSPVFQSNDGHIVNPVDARWYIAKSVSRFVGIMGNGTPSRVYT